MRKPRASNVAAWTAALLLSAAGAPAAAQSTAALMPTLGGHREIPEDVREEARTAALELLRSEDLVVLEPARLDAALDEAQRACAPGSPCAVEVRARAGVDLLVGLVILGTSAAPETADSVRVNILDSAGARYEGSASVQGDVGAAVREALRAALRDQRRGPGPFVRVEGTRDAAVEMDGAAIGSVPVTVRAEPGEHALRVSLEGYRPRTVPVTVPEDPAQTTDVEVFLERAGAAASAAGAPDLASNLLLGGGLAVAGLPLLVVGLTNVGLDGQCATPSEVLPEECRSRYRLDEARDGTLIALGGALLLTGVVLLAIQPIRVQASASSAGARLEIEGTF